MMKLQLKFMSSPDELAARICDDYCKWPAIWDEEKEGCQLSESDICKNCPLALLEGMAENAD